MSDRLTWATRIGEPATAKAIRAFGYSVEPYGQGMLTDEARRMLRSVPTPERWTPDFLVSRAAITGAPRWPANIRGKYVFLVDAKYRFPDNRNYSIEMRSLLAADMLGMDVFYVCATRTGDGICDAGVIRSGQVKIAGKSLRPCCGQCWQTFEAGDDPMHDLPEHCSNQERNETASSTPYVVFGPNMLQPLSGHVFDNMRPEMASRYLRDAS